MLLKWRNCQIFSVKFYFTSLYIKHFLYKSFRPNESMNKLLQK
nr:MAG TPA: hypothetical protein [Caudoviricetes sp.]